MSEFIYRLGYAWHFWRRMRYPIRDCWAAATAFDMDFVEGLSPAESVEEELWCIAQEADCGRKEQ